MKYVLVQTTYSPQREMVVELYLSEDLWAWSHTTLLSGAHVWDTFDEIADFVEKEDIDDHKVVKIKDEKLFAARLKGA